MAEFLTDLAAGELAGEKARGLLRTQSAGTGGWHDGEPMDRAAARQIRARGGEPETFRARRLRADMVDASELVLTATADQAQYVVETRPGAAARTFVLGEFGRLLRGVDLAGLPAYAPAAEAVQVRGVALVAAIEAARDGRPAGPADDLDDPWGRGDAYFGRVADEIEWAVRPLAGALLG